MHPETRSIYVNSPCNPTGWVMGRDEQSDLLAFCRERDILLIADEVYHRTYFDAEYAPSFLEVARDDDPLVVVNGFSKAWAMTGWRLGWVVTPARLRTAWTALSECFNTGATCSRRPAGWPPSSKASERSRGCASSTATVGGLSNSDWASTH